jgi:hypothetical protein
LAVVAIVRGDGKVSVGDRITFTYPAWAQRQYGVYGDPAVWTLQRVSNEWITTPTWLDLQWHCGSPQIKVLFEVFPDFTIHFADPSERCSVTAS